MKALSAALVWPLITVSLLMTSACSGEEVVGAHVDWTVTLDLRPGATSFAGSFDVLNQPEVGEISGAITCGALDLGASSLTLTSFIGGQEGEAFSLSGVLIDDSNGDELPLFTWNSTLSQSAKQVTFQSSAVDVDTTAVSRIEEILATRTDKKFTVRYNLNSANPPEQALLKVVHRVRVASDQGSCQ